MVRDGATDSVAAVCTRYGISPATYFRWKKEISEAADASATAAENRRLQLENERLRREAAALRDDLFAVRQVLMGKLRQLRSDEMRHAR